MNEPKWIRSKAVFQVLCEVLGITDWHEPDQQSITMLFKHASFDNAFCDDSESYVSLYNNDRNEEYCINLCQLLAWANDDG